MNKQVNPEQLELAASLSRKESSLLARAPHLDSESSAFKADLAKVDQIAVAAAAAPVVHDEEFDWHEDDSIILREQRATAAYRNRYGDLVIRQQAGWNDDQDTFIHISPENEITFLEGLAKRAREG
ncbi:hypothetical protein AB7M49_008157 [Bradyrhizobium elkanii]